MSANLLKVFLGFMHASLMPPAVINCDTVCI